jgi:putative tryptophan/tyrosine transport system substrate-binding protein
MPDWSIAERDTESKGKNMTVEPSRRELVALIGSASLLWPARGLAQNQPRKIAILMPFAKDDADAARWLQTLKRALDGFGWPEGKAVTYEEYFTGGNPAVLREQAAEIVQGRPDLIVTYAAQPIDAVLAATRTIPVVVAGVGDILTPGYVASLSHPGGNITGLTLVATDQTAKRLQLLREAVPNCSKWQCFGIPAQRGIRRK